MTAHLPPGQLLDCDLMDYEQALHIMNDIVNVKIAGPSPDVLMLLEHPAVITLGRRSTESDLCIPKALLKTKGIDVFEVERGGLATYHGPGQLVGYLMIDLRLNHIGPSDLVNSIEIALIDTLSDISINASQKEGYRGVWAGEKKIVAIGIAVRRGISFHGFALNCNPDLSHFDLINPCGLGAGVMTSATQILGKEINPIQIKENITSKLQNQLGISFTPTPVSERVFSVSLP